MRASLLLMALAARAAAEPDVRLRDLGPHQAAKLIAELCRAPLIAVGGSTSR